VNSLPTLRLTGFGLLILLVISLAGCGGPERQVVGTWRADFGPDASSPLAKLGEAAAPTLEVKADRTFTLSLMGMPVEGQWEMQGQDLSLKPAKVAGVDVPGRPGAPSEGPARKSPAEEPMVFNLSDDGRTLHGKGGLAVASLKLVKQ
jgi:hypothetical protein